MRKQLLLAALCVVLAACSAPEVRTQAADAPPKVNPRQQAVAQMTKTYALGKVPDQDREQAFQDLLDSALGKASRRYAGDKPMEIGFSYSMTPRGAVYPFSDVEVSCLVQAPYASGPGKELCREFFGIVDAGVIKIAGE